MSLLSNGDNLAPLKTMNTNVRHPFEHYTDVNKVGEGTYGTCYAANCSLTLYFDLGTVYKGKRRSDGTIHALKQIVFKEYGPFKL